MSRNSKRRHTTHRREGFSKSRVAPLYSSTRTDTSAKDLHPSGRLREIRCNQYQGFTLYSGNFPASSCKNIVTVRIELRICAIVYIGIFQIERIAIFYGILRKRDIHKPGIYRIKFSSPCIQLVETAYSGRYLK